MKNRFINDLAKQLPLLEKENVIDEFTSEKIRKYYNIQVTPNSRSTVLTIAGSLSALLIGAGIILLFAYNRHEIPKWTKTGLSFIPLITAQFLVYYSWANKKSSAWIEFSSLFLSLAVGSVIALISQIYQLPGDLGNFLLIWMLLILPLNYLTGSIGSL